MKRSELRAKLSEYPAGGNYYLLFDYLLELKKKSNPIEISQQELAKDLNRTRPSIRQGLEILKALGLIDCKYNKITIKIEVTNG